MEMKTFRYHYFACFLNVSVKVVKSLSTGLSGARRPRRAEYVSKPIIPRKTATFLSLATAFAVN